MIYILIFLGILLVIIFLLLIAKNRETNIQKALNMPKHVPPCDDSIKQAEEIGHFLFDRTLHSGRTLRNVSPACGIKTRDMLRISEGKDSGVAMLIRICHALGCEIVIRQTGTDDLESKDTHPEVFAEKIIKMREEDY